MSVIVYSFARVSAGVTFLEDYFEHGKRSWLRHTSGGKGPKCPAIEAYLEASIEAAGIAGDKNVRPSRATN